MEDMRWETQRHTSTALEDGAQRCDVSNTGLACCEPGGGLGVVAKHVLT